MHSLIFQSGNALTFLLTASTLSHIVELYFSGSLSQLNFPPAIYSVCFLLPVMSGFVQSFVNALAAILTNSFNLEF